MAGPRTAATRALAAVALAAVALAALAGVAAPGAAAAGNKAASAEHQLDALGDLLAQFAQKGPPLMSGDGLVSRGRPLLPSPSRPRFPPGSPEADGPSKFKKFVDRAAAPCQDEGTCGAAATTLLGGLLVEDAEGKPDPFRTLAGLAKEAFGSGELPEMPQQYVKKAAAFFDELPDTAKARIVKAAKAMGKEVKVDDLPWMKQD